MRTQETFQAWLEWSKKTLQRPEEERAARDTEGQRLWAACLADGWMREEGEQALRHALAKEELSV